MSTNPSRPLDISSPNRNQDDLAPSSTHDHGQAGSPAFRFGTPTARLGPPPRQGTPSTPPIANIPPRSAGDASPAPAGAGLPASFTARSWRARTPMTGGSSTPTGMGTSESPRMNLEDVTDEEMARVLRRHLVLRRGADVNTDEGSAHSRRPSDSGSNEIQREDSLEAFPIPYDAPGGDITHPIYKWQADQKRQARRPRAASFTAPAPEPIHSPHPAFEHIHAPGGFRRHYVLTRANERGVEEPAVSNNFIEFLYLFGHFAGEDLEEDEEDEEGVLLGVEQEAIAGPSALYKTTETAPLLGQRVVSQRSLSRARRSARRKSIGLETRGDATVTQAVLMLMKSFVGTGVLFLGKAFFNGGILFSAITMTAIAIISLYSFLLLVKTKDIVPGSYGDIGGALYGPWMRYAILTAIMLSQIGFVCAYTIFVSENLQAFVLAITKCARLISVQYFILMQLVIFLPLALVRNIAKLSSTALVADVFILLGLVYIFGSEIAVISSRGIAKVELFNPKSFPLLIGTAVFSFEGVGLVIPISDSMREPHKFTAVLTGVMLFLIVLFGGAGVLAYLAFGNEVQTVVITNLNSESKLVQSVQFLYSLAILLSVPLQLFPAVRIMENGLFSRSGKGNPKVKWQKNTLRFVIVMGCALISWAGARDLDKFVALVGSFACVPLCYVYPAMLHYKACARSRRQKIADVALMIFGSVAALYTTIQTISLMAAPAEGGPTFGKCDTTAPRS
ncbi:uncharacterized protein FOMMEDRAFT_138660 [Fomitiporia mediterranea MF3/22]|uniref:uncharacterized protein n=1 Tax=Fomitiporia mediterranea (strain MF3/22) TaxID=694068 RepID=UPI00044094AE|nr:uncharacterized protein FOMMEDRAFT_138660 [Fomitiporia mediterranea MF3/22]EJD06877.1 hypothetical protein FOMMEDRAFT_138660 [Fomitiporia mediterranea MF3/22]